MIRWVQLGVARVPGDGGELRLMQRGAEFSIMAGSIELMGSRLSGSEEALATLTCARVRERPRPHILIGGLGMGFTLRAAYAALRSGGVLAVWSSAPDKKFTARLRKSGFDVKEIPLRAKGPQGGAQHLIWTATRP